MFLYNNIVRIYVSSESSGNAEATEKSALRVRKPMSLVNRTALNFLDSFFRGSRVDVAPDAGNN